ncbi:MAG: type II toxin-antitoxin system RelE/ParE family toxin [Erysipelotrichaceae bacterium]|nr:type II toxin-antitoxin system RelE/ParE family toxin [Erysipelotrichaceae bacterium]
MNLHRRSFFSKDARIQYQQISLYIQLLQEKGTRLPVIISKHIENDLWELRPGVNRIFYFSDGGSTFVLLHLFRKRTQKTPEKELKRARREINDYLQRKGTIS